MHILCRQRPANIRPKHPPSKHQVFQALMSCLFDPDPDQVTLGGLHPEVSSVQLLRRQWPTALSPGKGAALASAPLASFAGSPASGLLRRPAPTAGTDPLAGEAPWPLCARCFPAVNPDILCRQHLGCRNVLSFDANPIPGLGLLHRTHWGSLLGVGVAIGLESAHRSKQPARYQSLIPTLTPIPTPVEHPKTGKRLFW
jgi:hypothetical protein